MKTEGIGFNSQWVASVSLEEFAKHESHHGLTSAQLKDIHRKCVKLHKPPKASPDDQSDQIAKEGL